MVSFEGPTLSPSLLLGGVKDIYRRISGRADGRRGCRRWETAGRRAPISLFSFLFFFKENVVLMLQVDYSTVVWPAIIELLSGLYVPVDLLIPRKERPQI